MIEVTLLYPNGRERQVLLLEVPHEGELIQSNNGVSEPLLIVDQVMWAEGNSTPPRPSVIVSVRPRDERKMM